MNDYTYMDAVREMRRERRMVWLDRALNSLVTLLIVLGAVKAIQFVWQIF